ncbi:MAG: hypothetical protein HUJ89_01980 [Bacteroidales bacterium]|nr:hypothetical protein [Bacteroidales bacterium]
MNSRKHVISVLLALVLAPLSLAAQNIDATSGYSPYSMFGIGDVPNYGSVVSGTMGGIYSAVRDNRTINWMNPAAITCRDTLSFMLDFGANINSKFISDGKNSGAGNSVNVRNFAFTTPIWGKSALVLGIAPYSTVGYKFLNTVDDPAISAIAGDVYNNQYGTGDIYQLFFGAAMDCFKRVSIGAQMIYFFGYQDRHSDMVFNSDSRYKSVYSGRKYKVNGFSGRFGIQYNQPIKKIGGVVNVGVTYQMGTSLGGEVSRYAYAKRNNVIDTLLPLPGEKVDTRLPIASQKTIGVSYRHKDKWMVGFDYLRENWSQIKYEESVCPTGLDYQPSIASSFKLGFEYTPNRSDIRYYMKRVTYRAGAYYNKSYVTLGGNDVNGFGFTFGMSFPIFRYYNAINVGLDVGQRGTTKGGMAVERYVNFMVSVNLHDIWFVKYRYD